LVLGGLGTAYLGWALHRMGDRILVEDDAWPRAWPYPDGWLWALNGWYDARHPVRGDSVKLHGEILSA
jgi:hypothetical protein